MKSKSVDKIQNQVNELVSWNYKKLDKKILEMKSGFACARKNAVSNGIPHLRPFNIGLNGELDLSNIIHIPNNFQNNFNEYYLEPGDILFNNTNSIELVGKSTIIWNYYKCGFSNHLTRLRILSTDKLDPSWLLVCLRALWLRGFFANNCNKWIGQAAFNPTKLAELNIPLPNIDIQRRIVARIETLLAEVQESRTLLEELRKDTEQLMFTALNEVINKLDKQYPNSPTISELISSGTIQIEGGGTPPRNNENYWNGIIPWVSPKDMKRWYIYDAQEHITAAALKETSVQLIPQGAILIVVRGMILAHSLPVAVTQNQVTINQDMKSLIPSINLLPDYLGYVIRARSSLILQLVETAAHGTKRLKTDTLRNLVVPIPSKYEQIRVIEYLNFIHNEVDAMLKGLEQNAKLLDLLEQSILERAFRGEL